MVKTKMQTRTSDVDLFRKRVALVIQGPVQSRGRTAASRNKPHREITHADVVDFDCTDTICSSIEQAKNLLGRSVYVAWSSDDTREIEARVGAQHVIRIEDDTPELPANSEVIPINNKFRQFTALSKGLAHLRSTECDFALKIRGDQSVCLDAMSAHLFDLEQRDLLRNKLVVPCFKKGMAFGIEEFYLGARLDILQEICRIFLSHNFAEFSRSVHTDLFGKLAWHFFGADLGLPLREFFIGERWDPVTKGQVEICRAGWDRLFITFPRDIWESAQWRGLPLGHEPANLYSGNDDDEIFQLLNGMTGIAVRDRIDQLQVLHELGVTDSERLSKFVFGNDALVRTRQHFWYPKLLQRILSRTKGLVSKFG
jgi:hypothetical protein